MGRGCPTGRRRPGGLVGGVPPPKAKRHDLRVLTERLRRPGPRPHGRTKGCSAWFGLGCCPARPELQCRALRTSVRSTSNIDSLSPGFGGRDRCPDSLVRRRALVKGCPSVTVEPGRTPANLAVTARAAALPRFAGGVTKSQPAWSVGHRRSGPGRPRVTSLPAPELVPTVAALRGARLAAMSFTAGSDVIDVPRGVPVRVGAFGARDRCRWTARTTPVSPGSRSHDPGWIENVMGLTRRGGRRDGAGCRAPG